VTGVISVDVEGDFGTDRLRGLDEILPELLDGFEARKVRSVLFVVGEVARQRPQAIRAAAARGHLIGSHSMTHQLMGQADRAFTLRELKDSRRAIEDITGVACTSFRAPFFDPPADLGPLLEEAGYRWSSSKAPFSPVAHYRWLRETKRAHRLAGSGVLELPVGRVLGLPMPEGLSYRRLFWPLTALSRRPPAMFYLHPYELLENWDGFGLSPTMRAFMSWRRGSWARRHLWQLIDGWIEAGATFAPPTEETLACAI
jgi:peptidoglycan/xylan/chitin deacetylase (PgdA/CDA1 family)